MRVWSLRRMAVLPVLVLALLVTPVTMATADSGVADTVTVAVEGGGEGEPVGPPVKGPDDEGNVGAPDDYEAPFVWAASFLLLGGALTLILVLGGLYYVLVVRPQQRGET